MSNSRYPKYHNTKKLQTLLVEDWCPLTTQLPTLSLPANNPRIQCLEVIREARWAWCHLSGPSDQPQDNNSFTTHFSLLESPEFSEMDLLLARTISARFQEISLTATINNRRYDCYRGEDGISRPKHNLSHSIDYAIRLAKAYFREELLSSEYQNTNKDDYLLNNTTNYKIVAVLAIEEAFEALYHFVNEEEYEGLLSLNIADRLLLETERLQGEHNANELKSCFQRLKEKSDRYDAANKIWQESEGERSDCRYKKTVEQLGLYSHISDAELFNEYISALGVQVDLAGGSETFFPCHGRCLAKMKREAVDKVQQKFSSMVKTDSSCSQRIGNEIRKLKLEYKKRGIPIDCFKNLIPSL
jgi:hypothetical protein